MSDSPVQDLVVSFCFPPYADTAAVVAAKRVRAAGRRVDVIQNAMDSCRRVDEGLAVLADHLVERREVLRAPTWFASWKTIRAWTSRGLATALRWDEERAGYARVYSRAQWAASHVLAARFAMLRPGARWTAEFSDPLSHDVTGSVRHFSAPDDDLRKDLADAIRDAGFVPPTDDNGFAWVEHVTFALADEIIFTNEHQRDLMVAAVPDTALRQRIRDVGVIRPHPTPDADLYRVADPELDLAPDRCHLAYFGNFYATRGLTDLFLALVALPGELRDRLQLHLFTSDPEALGSKVDGLGLGGTVALHAFVPYLDMLALCRRMDVLVVNDADTHGLAANPFLPSKWSDYRGAGTPVWGLVEPGSALSARPLDHRSLAGHPSDIVRTLATLARSTATPPGGVRSADH